MWLDYYSLYRLDLVRKIFQSIGYSWSLSTNHGGCKHKNKDKRQKLKIESRSSIIRVPNIANEICSLLWVAVCIFEVKSLHHLFIMLRIFMMQTECCSVWVGPNMDLKVNCNLRWFLCTNTFEEYAYTLLLKNRCVVCTQMQSKATFGKFWLALF
jgi:hypothetical protein